MVHLHNYVHLILGNVYYIDVLRGETSVAL